MSLPSDAVSVSMNPYGIYVPAKNKKSSCVIVGKKSKFTHEQHQVGNLPTVITAHRDSFNLLVNSAACNKKIVVVNEIVQVK